MTLATRVLRPALGIAVATAAVTSSSSHAAGDAPAVRLYLHSASGSYVQDAIGTVPYKAPAGSTMTPDKPTRTTSAVAAHRHGVIAPGLPTIPTFRTTVDGTVRGMCIDLFVASTRLTTSPPAVGGPVYINTKFFPGGATGTSVETNVQTFTPEGTGIQRLTGWAPAKGAPFEVLDGVPFVLHGLTLQNPDWTLYYDSLEHFSSITLNLPKEKCTPADLPAPKA